MLTKYLHGKSNLLIMIVRIPETFQYTASDYNYTPSVASPSALSQYGANFNHAFANPKQEDILADPLVASALVVSTYSVHEKQADLRLK